MTDSMQFRPEQALYTASLASSAIPEASPFAKLRKEALLTMRPAMIDEVGVPCPSWSVADVMPNFWEWKYQSPINILLNRVLGSLLLQRILLSSEKESDHVHCPENFSFRPDSNIKHSNYKIGAVI